VLSLTTSSTTMEAMAVIRAISSLETQISHYVCILKDSICMLRKIETVCIRQEWLAAIERSSLTVLCFIVVPGHEYMKCNERALILQYVEVVQCRWYNNGLTDVEVMLGGIAMDRSSIMNVIKDVWRVSDTANDSESTTMKAA
jgi:hypothetical protein